MADIITLFGDASGEYEEKRSRFICSLHRAETAREAAEFIEKIKKGHYGARHNCWAYVLADGTKRFSDDGEPQGTAGIPMLEVLEKAGVCNAAAVVTRYFGGVLLGAGGLVRAYSKAVSRALENSVLCREETLVLLKTVCSYSETGTLMRIAERFGCGKIRAEYSDTVNAEIPVPEDAEERFRNEITEAFAGRMKLTETGREKHYVPL